MKITDKITGSVIRIKIMKGKGPMEYYQQSPEEVMEKVRANEHGLTREDVEKRLEQYGFNEIGDQEKVPTWRLFTESFKDPMVVILLIAAGIQIVLGEIAESLIIFLVLIINAVISVVQTKKAESSLEALRDMSAPEATVIRDGTSEVIPARQLVPGDIVLLEAGDYIPADGRIIVSESLKVNEGMLTGESDAVEKQVEAIPKEVPLGDRTNSVFSSSLVVNGRGMFVVTATASHTEIGKIADMIRTAEAKQTPLQQKLEVFSKKLGVGILILCLLIFAVQALRIWFGGADVDTSTAILNALMFSVAIAVAAIPEALSSIVTIVLAVGTNNMAKQHAIIRKLPAVETLGSASVICTDKTGTLTQNKMTVTDYFLLDEEKYSKRMLTYIAALCNDATINNEGEDLGDPTETAIARFAEKNGIALEQLRKEFPRVGELPFDSDRKLMSTIHQIEGRQLMLTKGAPDILLRRASHVLQKGKEVPVTEEALEQFHTAIEKFSNDALRVLAYGYKPLPAGTSKMTTEDENDFVLVGLTAMMDPPREEVYSSIAEAEKAGIRTVMITGDHKMTAQAIADDIGIFREGDIAVTGQQLDKMTDDELDDKLESISVYARVSPENKIRIVRAWQRKGKITAMTGDGVNDAPALKQADIGVAMGSGTDVAKDSAAMILTDDNFVSIVKAVGVGRTVFDNIKKAISYLFAGNLGAIIAILYAVIFNLPNPFTALQLLFINLVNDSLPAIALGMEKSEPDVMNRKPRKLSEGIFAGGTLQAVLIRGIIIGIAVIVSFYIGLSHSTEMGVAYAFTTLILARTLQTFAARSNTQTAIGAGFFRNKYVLGAVVLGFLLYGMTTLPFARDIFHIPQTFGFNDFLIAFGSAIAALILMELVKLFTRKKKVA